MNDLRKAAEMALEFVEWLCGDDHSVRPKNKALDVRKALREALDLETAIEKGTKAWADVPNASEWVDELRGNDKPAVKSYCGGIANYCTPVDAEVDAEDMTPDRVDKTAKGEHEPFIYIREDTEMPFGGYEHCGEHDPGALPVYLAPPKRDSLSWVDCTDEQLMEEVRRRGFVIRDAQVGAKWVGLTGLEQKELMAMNSRYAVFETEARLKEKNG